MTNKKLWFRRKMYGWGWVPVSWEGWVVTIIYIVAISRVFRMVDATSHSNSDALIAFAIPFIILTSLLLAICYTKGEWPKWMWGRPKK